LHILTVVCYHFIGVVLKEVPAEMPLDNDDAGDDDDDERRLVITDKFKDFTYWNLDLTPSADDKIKQVMKWIDIAKVVRFMHPCLLTTYTHFVLVFIKYKFWQQYLLYLLN